MTPAPALPGMETSAEERAAWLRTYSFATFKDEDMGRLVRDFVRAEEDAKVSRDFMEHSDRRAEKAEAERDRAFAAGREAERAEIVAMIREAHDALGGIMPPVDALSELAKAIERGAHSPDTGAR